MCQFASFIFNPRTLEVKIYDLGSHAKTFDHFGLVDGAEADCWREGHYRPDGTISCCCLDIDTHLASECEAILRKKWPTFINFFNSSRELENYRGSLDLRSLTSAEGLILPKRVGGWLDLSGLTSAEGLILPKEIGGGLDLRSLTSAGGLTLPKEVSGSLDLRSLTSADGLTLPKEVGGWLDLSGLTSADGLILPKEIGGSLYLSGLSSRDRAMLMAHRAESE